MLVPRLAVGAGVPVMSVLPPRRPIAPDAVRRLAILDFSCRPGGKGTTVATQTPITILYVDDEEANRRSFSWIFRNEGFRVREAATGSEALRLAAEKPDLVVLDVNLPDMNGFEVCRRIKSHPATTSIPALHISAMFVRSQEKMHGLEAGADGYLVKPVEPQEMLAQVKALLRVRK